MNDRSAPAIAGDRPEPTPLRIESTDPVEAGDIVVVASMDADSPRRMVVALDSDETRRCFLGALVTNELSLATADDVILHSADTGLPYSIAAMTQLAGHLWFSQVCSRPGHLTDEALAAVRAGHAWAENDFQRERRGVPLQDHPRDLRWPDLTDEMRQMEELTMDCTLRRHEAEWAGPDGQLGQYISEQTSKTLEAYQSQSLQIERDANDEQDTAQGGYRNRQLYELVQNSADALLLREGTGVTDNPNSRNDAGRIEVRMSQGVLYCADNGRPFDEAGVSALMFPKLSPKRGTTQIGNFGVGFRAVLGVSDSPEIFSRSGSFRFDRDRARKCIREIDSGAEGCPVLSLPEPINPADPRDKDPVLRKLMSWASTIVRLPLKDDANNHIRQQMIDFPAMFLLHVPHVATLKISDGSKDVDRVLKSVGSAGGISLKSTDGTTEWRIFEQTHGLSDEARADMLARDEQHEVTISWAVPVGQLQEPGQFWAFFPTETQSLVPGVLNAPWKTNEDRQNLLPGDYNDELIEVAAEMISRSLVQLKTTDNPARHLDALPRRHESGDSWAGELLRKRLFNTACRQPMIPDQEGKLHRIDGELRFPPRELTPRSGVISDPFEIWARHPGRPKNWLHHSALNRTRLAAIDRLHEASGPAGLPKSQVPRSSIKTWLEALVRNAEPGEEVAASTAAIQAAAAIPKETRATTDLGEIVWTESGKWSAPDPLTLFLPVESAVGKAASEPDSTVHPDLAEDKETLAALRGLGLGPPSPERRFRAIAACLLADPGSTGTAPESQQNPWDVFWRRSRALNSADAFAIVSGHEAWWRKLRVQTCAGIWRPLHLVLMPGAVVPGDHSRDEDVTVDVEFHGPDLELLQEVGVRDAPFAGSPVSAEPEFARYRRIRESRYRNRDDLPATPQDGFIKFTRFEKVGPLSVLVPLSDEARARYTESILNLDLIYKCWEMSHRTRADYPKMPCESLPLWLLRKYGRVETPDGIVPLADALGPQPESPAALHALLRHPNAEKIKRAFNLSEPVPEVFGEGDPTPLTDIWPGLRGYLPAHHENTSLVQCERISVAGDERQCVAHANLVYLVGGVEDDQRAALESVAHALGLNLAPEEITAIVERQTPAEIEARHAEVRQCSTDAERLLAAVGERELRTALPRSLLDVIEDGEESLAPVEVAEAVIATFHTDALRQFRSALDHLGPPEKWGGSQRALAFVHSLGFSEEWAGERNARRPAFMKVEGPQSLPALHCYQRVVADNVRAMLRGDSGGGQRRGMLSMPTGSGKTRVAVQAIVEAVRHDGFRSGVLWVADRDELCEQAVEAWAQVWRSEGSEAEQLRISRMWSGQPKPLPTTENHVVVATIQTLNARLSNHQTGYEFLKDFKLVVFDEAHRSVAPTFTSVMQEIGLTRRPQEDEPFLIGLTATPYRGHDEAETARLVRRYGSARLDAGAFADDDPQKVVEELQDMRVLAQADHEVIEGGTFQLSEEEWEEVSRFVRGPERLAHLLAWLPQSVEDRIATSAERTRRILEAYDEHIKPDWPTLIFATSVEHAQTLAALLNRRGITARAVSGKTEPAARRRIVQGFRGGEIKALVNYGVFREGFDAPKTRAIIVARPVYSPNLYFQMIGRGLRGPLNGGDDRCLILNVRDNIEDFGRDLAFSKLDWLWNR